MSWGASAQASSDQQVHAQVGVPRCQPLPHDGIVQLGSAAPHQLGRISIGKEGSATASADLPGKDMFRASALIPRSKPRLQCRSPLATTWLHKISDLSLNDFLPSCVCML